MGEGNTQMKPIYETIGKNYSKTEFLKTSATDFGFFCEKVLGLKMMPFHIRWAEMFHDNQRSAVMAARQIGKTTICSVAYPLWYMFFNKLLMKNHFDKKPLRMLVVSNTMTESKRIIREQKAHIQNIDLLHKALYPSSGREGKLWTKMEYETANGCHVECRAFNENIRGVGVHRLLLNESSLFRDYFVYERALLPIVGSTGNLMSIGTPSSEVDVLAHQFRDNSFVTDKVPVLTNGIPTWEWKYNLKDIDKIRREMGELSFAREYMCEIVNSESQVIDRKAIVRSLNQDLTLNLNMIPNGNPEMKNNKLTIPNRVTGIDLAMSAQGDYSVSITLKDMQDGTWLLEHMDRKRGMNFATHKDWIQTIYNSFKPMRIEIDKSQFGQALIDDLRLERQIPCDPFKFTPDNRKEAISRIIQMIEGKRLIIPYNKDCPYTMQMIDTLIHELDSLVPTKTPTGTETYKSVSSHDDCAMALSIACSLIVTQQTGGFYMRKW